MSDRTSSDRPVAPSGPPLHRFAESLRELGAARDPDEALQLAVDLATELVPGIDVADIMFSRPDGVTTPVATDPVAVELDRAQQEAGDGPCLNTLTSDERVVSRDLAAEERWPEFCARAVELGYRSVAAFGLFVERDGGEVRFGAMNLFGTDPGLGDTAVQLGEVLAAHCSAVLHGAIEVEGLSRALESRDVIGQAKGILMERHRMSANDAYHLLRDASNHRNVKLRDLAVAVTETGDLSLG